MPGISAAGRGANCARAVGTCRSTRRPSQSSTSQSSTSQWWFGCRSSSSLADERTSDVGWRPAGGDPTAAAPVVNPRRTASLSCYVHTARSVVPVAGPGGEGRRCVVCRGRCLPQEMWRSFPARSARDWPKERVSPSGRGADEPKPGRSVESIDDVARPLGLHAPRPPVRASTMSTRCCVVSPQGPVGDSACETATPVGRVAASPRCWLPGSVRGSPLDPPGGSFVSRCGCWQGWAAYLPRPTARR